MKKAVAAAAYAVNEKESVIVREAVAEYFANRGIVDVGKVPLSESLRIFKETLSPKRQSQIDQKTRRVSNRPAR
jgi:hypothetical protein